MKERFVELYTDIAHRVSEMSRARRLQVGAVIVVDDVMIFGYNGTPAGWDNNCEDKVYPDKMTAVLEQHTDEFKARFPFVEEENGPYYEYTRRYQLKTKPEVLHAEMNALSKVAKTTLSSKGASLFVTHSPCIDCAKAIYQAGVKEIYYVNDYKSEEGVYFLQKCGLKVEKIDKS